MKLSGGVLVLAGLAVGVVSVAWAHVSMGGNLSLFVEPEAVANVFGGTLAALLISYPSATIRSTIAGLLALRDRPGSGRGSYGRRADPNRRVRVELGLVDARATRVVRLLIDEAGLDPARLSAAGYAEHRPRRPNTSAEARA